MSILSTMPVYLLSNSIALNRILSTERHMIEFTQGKFWEWMVNTAFMQRDPTRPDHVFEMRWKALSYASDMPNLMTVLECVANEYLSITNGLLYAKETATFGRWQNVRSRMTTLPIKAYFLYKNGMHPSIELTHPYVPRLSDYIKTDGLNEMHTHLSKHSYPEESWLYFLYNIPEFIHAEYKEFYVTGQRRAHYMHINPELSPTRAARRLRLAVTLRNAILELISTPMADHSQVLHNVQCSYYSLCLSHAFYTGASSTWVRIPKETEERLKQEANMWYKAFPLLEDPHYRYASALKKMLHLYLLIQNEFIQLYRHNERRRGLETFRAAAGHKQAFIGTPTYYKAAIARLVKAANPHPQTCIELRLSPMGLIAHKKRIIKEWHKLFEQREAQNQTNLNLRPKLILVAHFLKRCATMKGGKQCTEVPELYAAESEIYLKQAADFANHASDMLREGNFTLGIDAAGSELQAPPEVFAPAYRLFERRTRISHKTYHCGEDFHHLISGIRAIYEAVQFLDMKKGNRIGHATAIGIHPQKWLSSMPAKVFLTRQEWFLNLIFARMFIRDAELKQKIDAQLADATNTIFDAEYDALPLFHALRDMFEARKLSIRYLNASHIICTQDGVEEAKLCQEYIREHGRSCLELFERWRSDPLVRLRQNELVEIETDFLPTDALIQLQQSVQKILREREVVIEALLISNLRIGQYEEVNQHHILRWLGIESHAIEGDSSLNLCIGSDDPGIFVTDLKNEYYHLYSILTNNGLTPAEAMEQIRRVNETGRIYSFTTIPGVDPEADIAAISRSMFSTSTTSLFKTS